MSERVLYSQISLKRLQQIQGTLPSWDGTKFSPPTDVYETEEAIIVTIEVAGIQVDDLQVSLSEADHLLIVAGRRRSRVLEDQIVTVHRLEIPNGAFVVTVALPGPLEPAVEPTAEYDDGFLLITLPKARSRIVAVRYIE